MKKLQAVPNYHPTNQPEETHIVSQLPECPRCGNSDEYEVKVSGPHIGLYCVDCGRWLKWISYPDRVFLTKTTGMSIPDILENGKVSL